MVLARLQSYTFWGRCKYDCVLVGRVELTMSKVWRPPPFWPWRCQHAVHPHRTPGGTRRESRPRLRMRAPGRCRPRLAIVSRDSPTCRPRAPTTSRQRPSPATTSTANFASAGAVERAALDPDARLALEQIRVVIASL